jgi:cell division septation protein DedD
MKRTRYAVILALPAALTFFSIAGLGCAARSRTQKPPTGDAAAERIPPKLSTDEAESGLRLPGQNRFLPSEDPRNGEGGRSGAGAGASGGAVAAAGAVAVPSAPRESAGDPAAKLLPPPVPPEGVRYRVQVFASSSSYPAYSMRDEVAGIVEEPVYVEQEEEIWKVRLGDLKSREDADALRRRMRGLGYEDAFIVEVRGAEGRER